MQWADVLSTPWLQNLPFKIKLNRRGGVRVAGVAWVSNARLKALGWATPFPTAPELCDAWVVGPDGKRTLIHPPAGDVS